MRTFRITLAAVALLFCQLQSLAAVKQTFIISDIQVNGLQRVELGTFFTYLSIRVGEQISEERIPAIIRSIYHSGSFDDVEVMHDGTAFIINVQENQLTIKNDAVIVCAGGILPTKFLQSMGVSVEKKFGSK